ncbi:MAG: DUF6801 domain-containing protein [Parahaliea sp.]
MSRLSSASARYCAYTIAVFVSLTSATAWSKSQTSHFSVSCTEDYVNDGKPFDVGVTSKVSIPDQLEAGTSTEVDVSLVLTLPEAVAHTIIDNGYNLLEGDIIAIGTITKPSGAAETLTSSSLPLPSTGVPNPPALFDVSTIGEWPPYLLAEAGEYTISVEGTFVTVSNVTVTNSVNGESTTLDDFNCEATNPTVVLEHILVQPAGYYEQQARNIPTLPGSLLLLLSAAIATAGLIRAKTRR